MPKVFFDTNVLVYQLDKRDPGKQHRCRELVRVHALSGEAVISTQVLQEFYVSATGKLRIEPMLVKSIMRTFENMEVVTVTTDLIQLAADLSIQHQLSFWDALVVVGAQSANCEQLYSEDLNDGQKIGSLRVRNPFS